MQQQTIQKLVKISGVGLHTGKRTTLHIHPAPPDTGIIFIRQDLADQPKVPALIKNLHHRMRCTALKLGHAEVRTTEHLLATCFAMNIDNLIIEIDGPEIPGMDGSALPFLELLQSSGILTQESPAKEIAISSDILVQKGKASILARKYPEKMKISYHLDYGVSWIAPQSVEWEITEATFAKEIAPARTFVWRRELYMARMLTWILDRLPLINLDLELGKGTTPENTLILDQKGKVIGNQLRFPDEFARHKILDLLGDIALVGARLKLHLQANRSGHSMNTALAKKIYDYRNMKK